MTQRQLAEKCDEPGCLNIWQYYEWLLLLLLNQLHYYYYYYYYAAFNAPCVGHKDGESQTRNSCYEM